MELNSRKEALVVLQNTEVINRLIVLLSIAGSNNFMQLLSGCGYK